MYTQLIEFATPQFDIALKLRDLVLRQPLGMQFSAKDISQEYDSMHLACYSDTDQMIGILILKPIDDKILKMRQVAVSPDSQGKGVGTFLSQSAEKIARQHGFNKFVLHARETAVPFYKRMKYRSVGGRFDEVGIPHYKMEKKLS